MADTFTTAPITLSLSSKLDIKPTDIVLTDSEKIAEILINEGIQSKSLFYANRVALNDELRKYTDSNRVKLVLQYYSENTLNFIKENKIQAEIYYPVDTKETGLAIDKLEEMGGTTKPPITHQYR